MKKIIAVLMVAVLTLTMFAACGKKDDDSAKKSSTTGYVAKQPEFPSKTGTKEFKNESGKITPGSNSFVPSVMGLIMAGEIIKDLIAS